MFKQQSSIMKKRVLTGMSLAALTLGTQIDAQAGDLKFEVTITNITRGQILSPAVVASHKSGMSPLFSLGEEASAELAAVAEDAMIDPLIDALEASPAVTEVAVATGVNGPILPGESTSVTLDAARIALNLHANRISLVGMLVTTNDAFYGVNSISPKVFYPFGKVDIRETFYLLAYDAGSEFNSENCAFIPGPPCGNGGVHDPSAAEGFVHVHSGIHGVGDLNPSEFDWRNPVARVTVRLFHQN
jgi:hypothetical protein